MLEEKILNYVDSQKRQMIKLDIVDTGMSEIVGKSKFEGDPDLPKGFDWPCAINNLADKAVPLNFIAQIDLREASKYDCTGLLPKTGYLFFFYAACSDDTSPENKNCIKVYYYDCSADDLTNIKKPKKASIKDALWPSTTDESKYVDFSSSVYYPHFCRLDLWDEDLKNALNMTDEEYEEAENIDDEWLETILEEHFDGYNLMSNHIFGYADYLQHSWEPRCESIYREIYGNDQPESEWLLLLQYLYIPNRVHIYFFIRKNDLEVHRFDRVWAVTDFD